MRKTVKLILLVLFLAVFLLNCPAFAQPLTNKQVTAIEKDIVRVMKDWQIPGMAVAIVKDGKVVYMKGFGYKDLEKKLHVTPITQFAIASCSKAFTSFAAGLLVDDGKLDWDAPVISYLPDFRLHDPVATQLTTMRDLLAHQTGLPTGGLGLVYYGSTVYTRKDLYQSLKYFPSNKPFRQTYQYSNTGYIIAGYLEEQLAGKTWEELVAERIFKPLGMTNSNFSVEVMKKTPDYSLPYTVEDEQIREIDFTRVETYFGPAGSINSNAVDLSKWLMLHMNEGKLGDKQLISKATLKEIHSPQVVASTSSIFTEFDNTFYGLGWGINGYRGHKIVNHTGGVIGFTSYVGFMPEKKIGVILLANQLCPISTFLPYMLYDHMLGFTPIDWNKRFLKLTKEKLEKQKKKKQQEELKQPKNTNPSHPLQDYTGTYSNIGYKTITIKLENGSLIGKYGSYDIVKLKHCYYDVFQIENLKQSKAVNIIVGFKVQFHTDINGKINSLTIPLESEVITFTKNNK